MQVCVKRNLELALVVGFLHTFFAAEKKYVGVGNAQLDCDSKGCNDWIIMKET